MVQNFAGTEAGEDTSCSAPADIGSQKCDAKPSIRYFYDPKTYYCYPFKYSGCGGNDNNYLTLDKCTQCVPEDAFSCPGGAHERGYCQEQSDCPPDSTCIRGLYGLCCDNKATAQADNKNCGSKKIMQGEQYHGISCKHNFCPDDSECRENGYYAFCCK
ncbi:Kunitz/Bovine pancreatic trypsin inhibitor domain protein [Trichostrongylus colubriformis]|uniref:Kunitz/Bovine pancreatic trypsin inhibitor domain protein n=1 Tax=Trichostrongylus colubriformis TaxID=6319 RepID=A0AAN8IVV9_TRICO